MIARYRIEWATPAGALTALEPTADEVARHATALAAGYNDPRNAPLLGHTAAISPDEVIEHYAALDARGARQFLLLRDGALAGDADLRGIAGDAAEFAFLIAAPAAQGKGLGTRFATMIHALAFGALPLARIYASIVPHNVASRRVFDKLGYALDGPPAARAYAEDPDDVVMGIDRATFAARNAATLADIRIATR